MTLKLHIKCQTNQPKDVKLEKQNSYEPCFDYLKEKYKLDQISVIGLMIRGRGAITQFKTIRRVVNLILTHN